MKKYILSLALCAIALCNFAQIQSYKIVSQADEERVILPYDSLTNKHETTFRLSLDKRYKSYQKWVGLQ